jgi:hypothetical protein
VSEHKLKILRLDGAGEFRSLEQEFQNDFGVRIE